MERQGLAKGALGSVETAIMGIAGTAPAYSIAATTAAMVAVVGVQSVGSIFYCGLIMFGIVLAYARLSAAMPDAGAAFAWVGRVFGPGWGFMAGWGLLVASVVFTVSATIPAATATLTLIAPAHADSIGWVTFTAAVWYTIVTAIVGRGIKHASYVQIAFTVVEAAIIGAIIVAAFRAYAHQPAHLASWDWVSPFAFTPQSFAAGALLATFFYWGWDVTANLGEETRDGDPPPASNGAFWAMVNLIALFVLMTIVVLIVLTDREIQQANTTVLYAVAEKLFPKPWSYLAIVSTILSTIGTIETQVLQVTRSMFSMARGGALHPRYARVHDRWQTPLVATLVLWALGVVLIYASSYFSSVGAILASSISAIGLQICFYMALAGFACAWHFRDRLTGPPLAALTHVVWPGAAALFLVFIALWSLPGFDVATTLVGVGGLLVGLVPLLLARRARLAVPAMI